MHYINKNIKGIFKGHPTQAVLKLVEQQPLMNDKTVKLIDDLLTEFDFTFGPLPYEHTSLRISVPRGLATRESVQSTAVLLGTSLPSIFSRLWARLSGNTY